MLNSYKKQIFATAFIILLAVLIFNAPTKLRREDKEDTSSNGSIEEAAALVSSGTNPMKGIMMLRDILKKDPNNSKAHFQLGLFSIQSQQFDKAVNRFKKVIKLDNKNEQAYYYLALSYKQLGKKEEAIKAFENSLNFVKDSELVKEIEKNIKELKK